MQNLIKARNITTDHQVEDQNGNFSQVVSIDSDGVTPVLHMELSNGFKFSVGLDTDLNTTPASELVNLYDMPKFIQNVSNCSVSTHKGQTVQFTLEEAQELCNRNNLTLVGAMWPDQGAYTTYLAIEDGSIYLLSLSHSYSYDENGVYVSEPILQAQADNCGSPSDFDDELAEEWNNKIGQFVNLIL